MPETDCLPCYKAAMDGRARVDAEVSRTFATLKQTLDCMQTTASASPATAFDKRTEKEFLDAGKRFAAEVNAAAEKYATIATGVEKEARKRWPKGEHSEEE